MFRSRRSAKTVAILIIALVMASVTYAFAAANTMPGEIGAGEGSTTVSGYTISNVQFNLKGTNPAELSSVTFATTSSTGNAGNPNTVRIQLVTGGTWYGDTECTSADSGATWTCDVASANILVHDVNLFRVVTVE